MQKTLSMIAVRITVSGGGGVVPPSVTRRLRLVGNGPLSRTIPGTARPFVSVVMAFHNGAPYLGDAVQSVLAQSHGHLELLLCDDASTDDAPAIAEELAGRDARVRVLRAARKSGPGAARNLGLTAARGDWIAIVDADDLLHPGRIAGLLAIAGDTAADVIADDLVPFGGQSGTTLLTPLGLKSTWRPDALDLLRTAEGEAPVPVGYLKPMIRRSALGSLRYRTELPIGEDFDLLLRLALSGARVAVAAKPWYLYRRHATSTSHRLPPEQAGAILAGIEALTRDHPIWAETAAEALKAWRIRTERTVAFGELVTLLKRGKRAEAMGVLLRSPRLGADLLRAGTEGMARRLRPAPASDTRRPLILSARPETASGAVLAVPETAEGWDGGRAGRLARLTGSGARHLRAVGRPGLAALGHVPGWRLAELIAPDDGWTADEMEQIDRFPWPVVLRPAIIATSATPGARAASPDPARAAS